MSFHDTPELLEEILAQFGNMLDFLQLQINYVDWEQPNVQSRRCLEIARKYNKPVTVMEPCKGGTLVNLPDEASALLEAKAPGSSPAAWALRFAASQPGVTRVLSGMNTMAQVLDNTATFQAFSPITSEELETIRQVTAIIEKNTLVPCTGCAYCTHGCPKGIAIPQYFSLYNEDMREVATKGWTINFSNYNTLANSFGRAKDCIACGQCESVCPQHLPIIENLKKVSQRYDR